MHMTYYTSHKYNIIKQDQISHFKRITSSIADQDNIDQHHDEKHEDDDEQFQDQYQDGHDRDDDDQDNHDGQHGEDSHQDDVYQLDNDPGAAESERSIKEDKQRVEKQKQGGKQK